MKQSVVCIVQKQNQVDVIVEHLQAAGFSSSGISVLFLDKADAKDFTQEDDLESPDRAVAGVGAAGVLGGTIGLLTGIGALAIPGFGPLIAAGPLLAALRGAAAGANVGGVTGAFVGMGIPESEAKRYEASLKGGNVLVSVRAGSAYERKRAESIFKNARAEDICFTGDATVPRAKPSQARA